MRQSKAAELLDIPLPTYVAYERGTRKISRNVAEKTSAMWHVSPEYLMQAPPKGHPISISGGALTSHDARQASLKRLFGFDTWNGQRRLTTLAELLFLDIHDAIYQLLWGSKARRHGPEKR